MSRRQDDFTAGNEPWGVGFALLLATGFGVGLTSPFAPGTVGSLWGPILVWGLQQAPLPYWAFTVVAVLLILVGVPLCGLAARMFDEKDPGSVVYDEIVAFFVVFAGIPVNGMTAILGFLLFRVFDIVKPWPIRWLEKLPNGWGVMADDLVAALYATACLRLALLFIHP